MNIAIFEDPSVNNLSPITTSQPAYRIGCGGFCLLDFLDLMDANTIALVRPFLNPIQKREFKFADQLDPRQPKTLVINARLAPSVDNYQTLKHLSVGDDCVIRCKRDPQSIAAAVLPTERLIASASPEMITPQQLITAVDDANLTNAGAELDLFIFPHDVIDQHMRHCEANLEFRLLKNQFGRLADGVFVARQSPPTIHPSAAFDSSAGPIIFDSGVKVGPHCFFRGPVYIGPSSKISEHSSLKDAVAIDHTCKIGGEVEGCVIQRWTNKQHYGFLGHSYLGSWINLGAGTCNSDLKNTYGKINMRYGDQKIATDMQFVGCFIGDYAKTAINTSIFTGKTIGVASMIYGMATANVPSFVNHGPSGQLGLLPPEIAVTTQQRMFQRRNVPHQAADRRLMHDMFLLTDHERPSGLSPQPIAF